MAELILLAPAAALEIVPGENQQLILEVEKTGLMKGKKHVLFFPRFQGKVNYDDAQPQNSSVELQVEAGVVVCKDTWVSEKDRKDIEEYALELLVAREHPKIRFRSTKVEPKGSDEFLVSGNLEMRGVAKPVTVMVSRKPANLFEGSTRFRMSDWGIKPRRAVLGVIGTKDETTLTFALTAR